MSMCPSPDEARRELAGTGKGKGISDEDERRARARAGRAAYRQPRPIDTMKQPQFSASRSGPMSMGTLIAVAIVMMFLVILFTQLASPTMGSAGRRIGAATGKAKNWEGSFKTAGCDRGRCCCITHMNTKADSFNRVILSGKLLGACDEGVTSMAVRDTSGHVHGDKDGRSGWS